MSVSKPIKAQSKRIVSFLTAILFIAGLASLLLLSPSKVTAYADPGMDAELLEVRIDDAVYTPGDAPPQIPAGQVFKFELIVKNIGTLTWVDDYADELHPTTFLTRNPDYNADFGTFLITPGHAYSFDPGETVSFYTSLMAPATPGTYTLTWQLAEWAPYTYVRDWASAPFFGPEVSLTFEVVPRTDMPPVQVRIPGVVDGSDLEYVGSFALPAVPGAIHDEKSFYPSGITLRTVDGEQRMILATGTYAQTAYEVAIPAPGAIVGSDTSAVPTAELRSVFGELPRYAPEFSNGSLYYEQSTGLLYWTNYHFYYTGSIDFPTLRAADLSSGTLVEVAQWYQPSDLGGAPAKSFWGGVTNIPEGFASQYTGGKTLGLGFGGEYSINASASWGPALAAVDVPGGGGTMSVQPVFNYSISDPALRDGNVFYTSTAFSKNPISPWEGWWGAGCSVGSGVFIDLPDKKGYVSFNHLSTGRVDYGYGGANWNATFENVWNFYDYETLGQAATGAIPRESVVPSSMAYMNLPNTATSAGQEIAGSCFDADTRTLYVYSLYAVGGEPVVHVYSVLGGEPQLESIAVTAGPAKISYVEGESLDYTGLEVTATYSDGSVADVTALVDIVPAEGAVLDVTGTVTVLIGYTEDTVMKTTSFTVEVVAAPEPYLTALVIEEAPTKTNYMYGETFDLTGLKVVALYSDGSSADVTDLVVIDPASGTVLDEWTPFKVMVYFTDGSITENAFFIITFYTIDWLTILERIEVTSEPAKTSYIEGEALDLTGLEVMATYRVSPSDDSYLEDVTYLVVTDPADGAVLDTVGTQTVTVTYTDNRLFIGGDTIQTASFSVEVTAAAPASTYGVSLDASGMQVFDPVVAGYGTQTALSVIVSNTGNQPTGALSVALSGADTYAFRLSDAMLTSIAVDGIVGFSVAPMTGLAVGEYEATVTVSGANGIATSFDVSFEVAAVPKYNFTVTTSAGGSVMGTASGNYEAATPVSVTATANPGYHFTGWTISGASLAGGSMANPATFSMPTGAVTLRAGFVADAPVTYTLRVNGGYGSGNYPAGTVVSISAAAAPAGKVFDQWSGSSGGAIANPRSASTTYTMPANAATVTANYRDVPVSRVYVTGITVSSAGGVTSIGAPRETLQLYAYISPSNATNTSVTWSIVSGSAYASLSSGGLVTARADGTVVVRATAQDGSGVSGSITLNITGQGSGGTDATRTYNVQSQFGAWKGSGTAAAKISADPGKLLRLTLNGAVVDSENYTLRGDTARAETVITFEESYLKTLKDGNYTFVAEFSDGYSASLTLQVSVADDAADDDSADGDDTSTIDDTDTPLSAGDNQTGNKLDMQSLLIIGTFVLITLTLLLLSLLRSRRRKEGNREYR